MNKEEFIIELEKLGIDITKNQLNQLEEYYKLLIKWNNKINLTAITEEKEVYLKHFYDSLTIVKAIDLSSINTLCDVGTGAGFPGIIIKIMFPKIKITLIDSLNKRIVFLNEIIEKLNLNNIEAIHARMEDYSKKNAEKFDCIVTRAVANLSMILEISIISLKVNGIFIAMKGNCKNEIQNANNIMKELDCKNVSNIEFLLPYENSNRTLVKISKEKITKNKYPRSIDKIKKSIVK